jgi:hypothetical protein
MRLEPRARDAEMNTSLRASVYDPLWLLARQWQLGEFQGEDNGSPIMARLRAESTRLTRYRPGPLEGNPSVRAQDYDARAMPLETLVERERVRPEAGKAEKFRLAAEAGVHFLRLLDQQPLSQSYREAFKNRYPFPALTDEQRKTLDRDSLRFLELIAPRVPDGRALYTSLRAALRPPQGGRGSLPADPPIVAADAAEVEKAAVIWLQWYEELFSEQEGGDATSAWNPERMEHAFAVAARFSEGEKVLAANEYYEGHLDWYSFNVQEGASLGPTTAGTASPLTQITRSVIPAPASFRGMPAPRFWELEDARVDFGAIETGPEDLARMLLIEFAITYGNDWFVIPVELPVGSLCRTRSLVVTDTFGVRTLIRPSSANGPQSAAWRMFQLSLTHPSQRPQNLPAADFFLLPPVLMKSLESKPIEEVLFLRDEMSNMVWGVERLVESATERPLNRTEAWLEQERRFEREQEREREREATTTPVGTAETVETETGTDDVLTYQLVTRVPDYWIPFLPVRVDTGNPDSRAIRLKRGVILKPDGSREIGPQGRILEPGRRELALFEEEVPREGARVTRSYQYTRWIDGSTHLWVGRQKGAGRGEGSSGLRFDSVKPE